MSIIEKAFEKSGSTSDPQQEDELIGPIDERLEFEDFIRDDEFESPFNDKPLAAREAAESSESGSVGMDSLPEDEAVSQIKLDIERLKATGLIHPLADKTNRTVEQFRRIKRPLLMNVRGEGASIVDNANMIMVTSSLAGEGKTFTSINLAMSIAMEMDKTVLLIDADVAKPDVTSRLGIEVETGLIDVLLDEGLTLQDVLLKTDIPKLTLLPSGRRHAHATELLASERMRQLALEISSRYHDRVIIFDSPPLLLTNEARVLAGLMGQVVVVVEEFRTPQHVVKEAVGLLSTNEIVGIVLNKGMTEKGGYYYGGYSGYGYGYGYGRGNKK
jgi:exopolysaccharide/PEP-CTERM locus tyrosine autokinase